MDTSPAKNNGFGLPKPIHALLPLPSLSGLFSEQAMRGFVAKKSPRTAMPQGLKPLKLAEMKAEILALTPQPSRSTVPRKEWNSSVKIDRKRCHTHTAQGQLSNTTARRVLQFPPKPKTAPNRVNTSASTSTATQSHLQNKNKICVFSGQTQLGTQKPAKNRSQLNIPRPCHCNVLDVVVVPPTPNGKKQLVAPELDTPLAHCSGTSESDASFLQKEKEIEDQLKALAEEATLENLADVSPPVSTPFREYSSVQEYFDHCSYLDSSALCNGKKPSIGADNDQQIDNKATLSNETIPKELDYLLEVEKQTENTIKKLDNGIEMLTQIKEAHEKSLQNVKKLLGKKNKTL